MNMQILHEDVDCRSSTPSWRNSRLSQGVCIVACAVSVTYISEYLLHHGLCIKYRCAFGSLRLKLDDFRLRRTMGVRHALERVLLAYERLQVELQGQYSISRLHEFVDFETSTSLWRAVAIVVLTPLPCLLTIILLDLTPQHSAYLGVIQQTGWLWFRVGFSVGAITFCIISQLHQSAPTLPMPMQRLLTISTVLGVTGAGDFVALGFIVGFPTPFSLQLITILWFCKLAISLWISWSAAARVDLVARNNLKRFLLAYSSEMVVVFAYPIYYFVFTLLSGSGQTIFSFILPIMKLTFKNLVSYGMFHMEDLAPTAIVFNIDVFHALYISTTAQQSKSIGSTVVVMIVDALQMIFAFMDIYKVQARYDQLYEKLEAIDAQQSSPASGSVLHTKMVPIDYARHLLENNSLLRGHPDLALPRHQRRSPLQIQLSSSVTNLKLPGIGRTPSRYHEARIVPATGPSVEELPTVSIVSALQDTLTTDSQPPSRLTRRDRVQIKAIACVLQQLHMTEFYMLIEFAEVMMSMLFAIYLSVITRLPNRVHYVNLTGLSEKQLDENTRSVAVYALLELVSFLVMSAGLNRRLKQFSSIRQLAFALRKHYRMAQSMLLLWVLFVVQLSLTHAGTDYTFKFAWLHYNTTQHS